jgi:hypothetical protein
LFLFPTFMLFVYLIYETAKLSREKIRHQFAIDAAVFVEMTNYSDFLNRTAYVNGAFPMRIFSEGFGTTCLECDQKANCTGNTHAPCSGSAGGGSSLWRVMCQDGDFPVKGGSCDALGTTDQTYGQSDPQWQIQFGGAGQGKNSSPPEMGGDTLTILTMDDANHFWISWNDSNEVYKLYVQIYQLLGSVEDAQYSVLTRLTANHNFLKKSYWLNTGSDINAAVAAATTFGAGIGSWSASSSCGSGNMSYCCYQYLNFYGNKATGSAFQPWQVYAPQTPPSMPQTIGGCSGLFHLMWISPNLMNNLRAPQNSMYGSRGVAVPQTWTAPSNYFNINFNAAPYMPNGNPPTVHVTVAVDAAQPSIKAAVWSNPTPKFQVRSTP